MPKPVSPNLLSPESSESHSPKSPLAEEQFASWLNFSTYSEQRVFGYVREGYHPTCQRSKLKGTNSELLLSFWPQSPCPLTTPPQHTPQAAVFLLRSPSHPRGWLKTSEGQGTRRKSKRGRHMRRERVRPQRTRLPSEVCCSAGGQGVLVPGVAGVDPDAVAEASDWKLDTICSNSLAPQRQPDRCSFLIFFNCSKKGRAS